MQISNGDTYLKINTKQSAYCDIVAFYCMAVTHHLGKRLLQGCYIVGQVDTACLPSINAT